MDLRQEYNTQRRIWKAGVHFNQAYTGYCNDIAMTDPPGSVNGDDDDWSESDGISKKTPNVAQSDGEERLHCSYPKPNVDSVAEL
jgi:hypothetical protein